MTTKVSVLVAALVVVSTMCAAQDTARKPGAWSGVIISGACSADDAFAEAEKCTARVPGQALVLYDDTTRTIYKLEPQPPAALMGESVAVKGLLDAETVRGAAIERLTAFGIEPGRKAPGFSARDQFGKVQTLDTLKGPKGTILLFFRSADWCPYCKGQLIQLQSAKARFEAQGLKLAGISYDSEAILKSFSDRRHIEFPLLSDVNSTIIRAYDVLNAEATGQNLGMARPGYFFVDPTGVIRERLFEVKYRERLTGNNVLARLFPALGDQVTGRIDAPHLQLAVGQSDRVGVPGNVITLTTEVRLPADVHVYAPGAQGYKPIKLVIDPVPEVEMREAAYPRATVLYLPAIQERVPVFAGTFRIRQEMKVNTTAEFSNALGSEGRTVAIKGRLEYQACDSKICFLPTSVPVEWQLQVVPLDRQRAPEDIRHK